MMPCGIKVASTIEFTLALSPTFTKDGKFNSRRHARPKTKVNSSNFYGPGDGAKYIAFI